MSANLPVIAVVPVKETRGAKQRLASVLSSDVRQALALAMLEDVLDALSTASCLAGILVVTVDAAAERLARAYGATISTIGARAGHTAAVTAAAQLIAARGAAMLTIPGDVPLIRSADVESLAEAHREGRGFTIAPAHDERGSNAILCSPANAVPLRFGDDSYFPHLAAARACGIEPVTVPLPRLALDIDGPADLRELLRAPGRTRAHAVLQHHGISERSLVVDISL
jgi:2-phospho-L-lactate guanylyltransferase